MKKKFQILFKIMKNYIILIFLMMIRKKMKKGKNSKKTIHSNALRDLIEAVTQYQKI